MKSSTRSLSKLDVILSDLLGELKSLSQLFFETAQAVFCALGHSFSYWARAKTLVILLSRSFFESFFTFSQQRSTLIKINKFEKTSNLPNNFVFEQNAQNPHVSGFLVIFFLELPSFEPLVRGVWRFFKTALRNRLNKEFVKTLNNEALVIAARPESSIASTRDVLPNLFFLKTKFFILQNRNLANYNSYSKRDNFGTALYLFCENLILIFLFYTQSVFALLNRVVILASSSFKTKNPAETYPSFDQTLYLLNNEYIKSVSHDKFTQHCSTIFFLTKKKNLSYLAIYEHSPVREPHIRALAHFNFGIFSELTNFFKILFLKTSFILTEITNNFFQISRKTSYLPWAIIFDVRSFTCLSEMCNFSGYNVFIVKRAINAYLQFSSHYLIELDGAYQLLSQNEEASALPRYLKVHNPIFKYDYKSGDYFPKLYKELYPHLFSSLLDLTSGLRTSPWFLSNNTKEVVEISFALFAPAPANSFSNVRSSRNLQLKTFNKFYHTDPFYNLFSILKTQKNSIFGHTNISVNALNLKFQKMFLTSSMQQRVHSNWRQLKFTRESWRCKLLAARHQKTLFKRYVNEDGVFWSIERNAKDLIPGWAMITPFSARTRFTAVGKTDIGLMGVLLVLNSSIVSGANFLVTYRYLSTLNNRKMRDARAFFTEAVMVASWMMILANPMLVIGIIMLLSDRHWQTSFFDYSGGGDTVLFQHMFWFFGHPEVYIIILPTFGFTNTMLSYYLKKRVSARASLLYSMYTIAFLGFFVWGHHMYMVGLAHTTRMLFSTLTVMISVPAATKIMHWCVTTVNSAFTMELPLLFTFTFIFFFVSGGISGMCVAHTGMDVLFHDTFYVIAHFHVMLAGGAMFASFGAFYFYFSSIFGVKYSRIYAYLHYSYYLIGQLMTIVPMFWLGYAGMPRRVLDYPASFGGWHSVISAGHMLNVAGLIAFFIMIFDSLRQARACTRNNFGINRFNTRLNFYIYETARSLFLQQKTLFLYKQKKSLTAQLNDAGYANFESFELSIISYSFTR